MTHKSMFRFRVEKVVPKKFREEKVHEPTLSPFVHRLRTPADL